MLKANQKSNINYERHKRQPERKPKSNLGRKLIGITQEKEVKILVYSPFHLHKFL